ncbi:MAG: hypothetical protein IKR74_05100 [Bacilli bacterium]|nr:hypothetical protein [Bacilli bacterium]
MKYVIKYIFLFSLLFVSFFYADKVSKIMINNSELMKKIKIESVNYNKSSDDAVIIDNYIVPGKNGIVVDELASYYQMKSDNTFNSSKLVFKQVKPNISISNNKELVINKVSTKSGIALVFKDNKQILDYLSDHNIIINRLVTVKSFNKNAKYEQIGIEENVDKLFDKYKLNKYICFEDYLSKNKCIEKNKYLVNSTYIISNSIGLKSKVVSGNILYLEDSLKINDFKYLLNIIKTRDLTLYFLSEFISEEA